MKLFVQIPCLNEEATLASVIRDIPRHLDGVDEVKVLIIDDGSRDDMAEVAGREGADYVVHLPYRQELAKAFALGLNRCLELGADIIVNTAADHRYRGADIAQLVQPILEGKAGIVIGDRQARASSRSSFVTRCLRTLGSRTVSLLANIRIPDVTSDFRAYSREAALRLNVFSKFTYTLETAIQAGTNQIAIAHIPIQATAPRRNPHLSAKIPTYLKRSVATILRIYTLYEPLRTFFYIGAGISALGLMGLLRFLYFWLTGGGQGHVQSLIISAILLIIGFQVWMLGIIADLISVNRRLNEDILYRLKKQATVPKEGEDRAMIVNKGSR